jgi:hypothetical protein
MLWQADAFDTAQEAEDAKCAAMRALARLEKWSDDAAQEEK